MYIGKVLWLIRRKRREKERERESEREREIQRATKNVLRSESDYQNEATNIQVCGGLIFCTYIEHAKRI